MNKIFKISLTFDDNYILYITINNIPIKLLLNLFIAINCYTH
jgi:hypothetical protein